MKSSTIRRNVGRRTAKLLVPAVVAALTALPAWGQAGALGVAVQGGYAWGIDDTPPHAILKGVSVSVRAAERWRIGVEYLDADMFGPSESTEARASLITPTFEYEFRASGRLKPFIVFGVGYTHYRDLIPGLASPYTEDSALVYEWEAQSGINLAGGMGVRMYLTKRLYVAPEVRIGLVPVLRTTVSVGYSFR